MSSIISGYEYDVFISYRQKDNKHDGWVTEFIDNLKAELESTFKAEIGVYFDTNPIDGLLETHDVDESLKSKLKCLIFIPIISRTYVDKNSFAWENEFKEFVEAASHDQFGLKVKLHNGNIANRVLPVRIYDLEPCDIKLCESILGGVIRSIDFVYRSAGVNRPLRADEDHPHDNLNMTYYRDQINKVALSVEEILNTLIQHFQQNEEKVVPVTDFKPITLTGKSGKNKIILGSAIVMMLLAVGFFLITTLSKKEELEKSITVLPFINDSPDQENTYFINGIKEEILSNFQKISDLRVVTLNTMEPYSGSTHEIARKLGVNYIVAGSGQKYGNKIVLRVRLIDAKKETNIWNRRYDREIQETNELIAIQSEIAQLIAAELNAIITPEEKQRIEKTPTANLTAYDFYQRGREEQKKNNLQKAQDFYLTSLKHDSTFAPAYSGLATLYWARHYDDEYFSKNFMDSVLILINLALTYDSHLAEPYSLKGRYYAEIGEPEKAIVELDKAIQLNPNDWIPYWAKGHFYYNIDIVKNIYYLQKASSINRGPDLPDLLLDIGGGYLRAGFPEKSEQCYLDKLNLDGDSLSYYSSMARNEFWFENFNKSIEYAEKGYAIDSTNVGILSTLGMDFAWTGRYKESLKYYKKWMGSLKAKGELSIQNLHRLGYIYWQNGYKKEAEYYLNEQIKICNKTNKLKRLQGQYLFTYYDLAGIYAFRGEKDKAYKNLRIFNTIQCIPAYMAMLVKTDPLFNNIRNEEEFQKIARDLNAKYQLDHERVRKWLEDQDGQ